MSPLDLRSAMAEAMATLTERQRDVFVALSDGHNEPSVADVMGISYQAVQQHNLRARAHIAAHLLPLLYQLIQEEETADQ